MTPKKGLLGLTRTIIFSKLGIIGLTAAAAYWGYANYDVIKRVEYNTTKRNIVVEKKYFPDPAGLCIDTPINSNGKQEVYVVHKDSGKRIPLYHDLLPENKYMLDEILERVEIGSMGEKERKQLLKQAHDLQSLLYEQDLKK